LHPDPELEKYLDDLIYKIAAAQEDDGYLYTARTIDPENPPRSSGPERWSNLKDNHELYNVGHMYEAAVAHHLATGKRTFLDVAIKNADLINTVFGPEKKRAVPGHQEIEIGLVKLYRVTGDEKYLKLAKFFLDGRGYAGSRSLYGSYCQDHKPVVEQDEAIGHAVRAAYMYSGMADVAALSGDKGYVMAIDRIWEDVVSRKLYLTGGIGAKHSGEAFGEGYELPNRSAYNETCAAIANILWNQRLFLLHGDAKYIDVLERTLYNGFLSGVSMEGNLFFYPNPLESMGNHKRSPWFNCSCCPTNVVRFLPSLPGYVYAVQDRNLYVNLFIASSALLRVKDQTVRLKQTTDYPWEGNLTIMVDPECQTEFTMHVRIPGWARNRPVPGDLYRYMREKKEKAVIRVNGKQINLQMRKGFAMIKRSWQKGDVVELHLPMPVRQVVSHENVKGNMGKVALERGPIVYCAEWKDNNGHVLNLLVSPDDEFISEFKHDLLNGVTVLKGNAYGLYSSKSGDSVTKKKQTVIFIPYYAWAHRGEGEMAVWIPFSESAARPLPPPSISSLGMSSASHVYRNDTVKALNDQMEPGRSNDHSIPRFTWWDHKGTTEWVKYEFDEQVELSMTRVYWFDDGPQGGCRVPSSWNLFYLCDGEWRPVVHIGAYTVNKDEYNDFEFEPVKTRGLMIKVKLQQGFSGGILEWRAEKGNQ
jgi:DUF1680 family protein